MPALLRPLLAFLPFRTERYRAKVCLSALSGYPFVAPRFASIIVTENCNSRCTYCDYWRKPRQAELPLVVFCQICRQLKDLGAEEVVLSGGEPLLRGDIATLVGAAKESGLNRVGIITNGSLLTAQVGSRLIDAGLSWLELSLDSLNEEIYAAQRGIPLRIAFGGLETLVRLKQDYPGLGASIHCVVSKRNLQSIPDLVDLARGKDLNLGFQPYHRSTYGNAEDALSGFDSADLSELSDACHYLVERKQEGFLNNSTAYLNGIPPFVTDGPMPRFGCLTGFFHVIVDGDLNVRPCWSFPPVGRLGGKTSLRDLWFAPAFRRQRLRMARLPRPCCWLNCHIEPSLPFQSLRLRPW